VKGQLSARKLVDFDGPHGAEFSAANLGRLDVSERDGPAGVPWGLREVRPLVEVRIPFVVNQMELDNIDRGCKDAGLGAVEEAARKLALFEETAIYKGFEDGRITGIGAAAAHEPVHLSSDAKKLTESPAD
jgi:uncharacterized linocin/CFP29 family protein